MSNPVVVITGASRGIGKAIALNFAKRGYDCALVARSADKLEALQAEIQQQFGVNAGVFALDVADKPQVDAAIERVIKAHGQIDVLFNNAGIVSFGTSEVTPEELKRLIETNLIGAYNFIHAIAPHMKNKRQGYIFNLASRGGKEAIPELGAYALTKFGMVGFSEALYQELLPFNVKVTAICPCVVATDMTAEMKDFPDEEKIQTEDISKTVNYLLDLGRTACVKDIVVYCKYLEENPMRLEK